MDLVDIIHSSLMYTLKRKPIKETMSHILDKIISITNDDYGFIGEIIKPKGTGKDVLRYHVVYGFKDIKKLLEFNEHFDFDYSQSMHKIALETKKAYYNNNMNEANILLGHETISKFIVIPLMKNNEIIGLLGLGKKSLDSKDYDDDTVKFLKPISMLIGSVFLHIKDLINVSDQKDMFLANISHEIRTPLNGIVCLSKLLTKTKCTDEQNNYIQIISQCSIQLLEIVNDILDYSKIGKNKLSLHHKPVNFKQVISSACDVVRFKAMEKDIDLNYSISDDIPSKIIADNTRLCQILVNLLNNAIKFTKKGYVLLKAFVEETNGTNYSIHFIVEDTGIGIPKDKVEGVFDTYTQIPNNYIAGSVGVGLGLPISKHIVSLFNGNIWVESDVAKGTKVHFTINVKKYNNVVNIVELKKFYTGKSVLIIDNNTESRSTLFASLVEIGIKPVMCQNMKDANMYLISDLFSFEFIVINIATVTESDIVRLNNIKDSSVKIILVDQTNPQNVGLKYDYSLRKPISKTQLKSVFNLIFVEKTTNTTDSDSDYDTHKDNTKKEDTDSIKIRKKIKILVAEDIITNQKVIITLLKSLGHRNIDIVSNGLELIKQLKLPDSQYDIVFVDLKMPELDGIAAAKIIVDTIPKEKYGKLVALTASISNIIKRQCFEAGMTSYITKPIDIEELISVIDEL